MKAYYSKRLQKNSKRYTELQNNKQLYFNHSIEKENTQKFFCNTFKILNCSTGEDVNIVYDFEKKHKQYSRLIEQRALSIQEIARKDGRMVSLFGTINLPSKFHPFRSIQRPKYRLYVEDNQEFSFDTLLDAVSHGYSFLNHIIQTFYKRIKNFLGKDLLYVKCIENHVTMIPHCHFVLYFPIEHLEKVILAFQKIIREFKLNRTHFEQTFFRDDLNYASKYLLKYITKDLNNSSDLYKARVLDGWKRFHKIRVLTTSQLPLNVMVYKKIYNAVSFFEKNRINSKDTDNIQTLKEEIDEKVKKLNVPLFLYFQDNSFIQKTVIDGNKKRVVCHGQKGALFDINYTLEKKGKSYQVKSFEVSYKSKNIYTKQQFIKLRV